ncbi:proteoglycan 4b [Kryptolebias marmoratus]|uniref:proteoglycan 4b n=1 Tax=Kryptolebias marmoratus TaxID=37003 RepID=UPI0007F86F0F|nr:proteoglycan 4b [Kryptolebias marmoratus]
MMSSKILCAVILMVCALTFGSSQSSCRGRCGGEYYRGYTCQCDYNCLAYEECCRDYESQCTTKNSCKGRCGETFKRGRLCSCDPECTKFKQCCPDYSDHCDADEISEAASETAPMKTNSCEIIHDNKPKESTLTEETEDSFSEGNLADDYSNPLESATTYPPDDPSDVQDQETSPTPESSSSFGPTTADLLDDVPAEALLGTDAPEFTTERAFSPTEPSPSDNDNLFSLYSTAGEATTVSSDASDPTNSPDQGTTLPQPDQPTSTSEPTTSSSAIETTANIFPTDEPEITTSEPTTSPSATETTANHFPADEPEITTVNTPDLNTALETSQDATSPAATPEGTPSDTDTEMDQGSITTSSLSSLADVEDPSTTVSPAGTGIPTSTVLVQDEATETAAPEITTADPLNVTSEPTSKPQDKPDPPKLPPTSKSDTKPVDPQTPNTNNPRDYQSDDSNDTNLCSGRPISGVTALRNGTMVVFRGHYFWFLDRNRVPSSPRGITEVWGVPSPIDTVFTRCNCQGKTYIFKAGKYWRFENDVLDAGYPKVIKRGFNGLQGQITAALTVPQYQSRKESVYFFKRGGFVQKYSYQSGTSPTCGSHNAIHKLHARVVRQAVSVLEPEISIRKSWRGFPHTITAAVSIPSTREPEGYRYTVFLRSIPYNVRIDGERPVTLGPKPNTSPRSNTFFKCQNKP